MVNPLVPGPIEVVLATFVLLGPAVAVFLIVGAARERFEWVPAGILAFFALAVPLLGSAVALYCIPKLYRTGPAARAS